MPSSPQRRLAGLNPGDLMAQAGLAGVVAATGWWKFFSRKTEAGRESGPVPDSIEPVALEGQGAGEDWDALLGRLSLPRDTISGIWRREGRAVTSGDGVCILALRDQMPAAYNVRAVFTRLSGDYCAGVFFRVNGMTTSVDIDGWDKDLAGVQTIDGQSLEQQKGAFRFPLEDGRRYELSLEVRSETVKIWIDGRELGTVDIAGRELGVVYPWMWDPARRPAALAIGSFQSPTRFEAVSWRSLGD